MEQTNNQKDPSFFSKKSIIVCLIFVVIIVALLVSKREKVVPPLSDQSQNNETETINNVSTDTTQNTSKKITTSPATTPTTTPSSSLSRTDALAKYQKRIIRITNNCSANPYVHSFLLHKDDTIMIDNDSNTTHQVIWSGTTYTINPHNYRLVTLPDDGVISSMCDETTKITTIMLQ